VRAIARRLGAAEHGTAGAGGGGTAAVFAAGGFTSGRTAPRTLIESVWSIPGFVHTWFCVSSRAPGGRCLGEVTAKPGAARACGLICAAALGECAAAFPNGRRSPGSRVSVRQLLARRAPGRAFGVRHERSWRACLSRGRGACEC